MTTRSTISENRQSRIRSGVSSSLLKSTSRMQVRRTSYGFKGVPGVRPTEQGASVSAAEFKRPPLVYLPTFQLDPSAPFNCVQVQKSIDEILDVNFADYKYDSLNAPSLALQVAGDIMHAVKHMRFNRYRVISVVTIAQKRAQSYNNAIAFLWDYERDKYVDVQREFNTAFIQATVFGVYLD